MSSSGQRNQRVTWGMSVYTTDRNGYPRSQGCDFWYVFLMRKRYLKKNVANLPRARDLTPRRKLYGSALSASTPRLFSGAVPSGLHLQATCRSNRPHAQGCTPALRCRTHNPVPDYAKRKRTAFSHLSKVNLHNRVPLPWASTIATITRDLGDPFEAIGEGIVGDCAKQAGHIACLALRPRRGGTCRSTLPRPTKLRFASCYGTFALCRERQIEIQSSRNKTHCAFAPVGVK